ncbi:MAG: RNA-binding transcriptional accessory protein [Elusimicrobia bacterium RIFOXYA12_FULL_51_18]|nr:MAG: RNA-binding transcriptional accessory protein [Elusimicrobia bacterium RIFOXYA12_FULL_51_18]OGS30354.1 MAG: RNA-binding transcriptional accessory protein [Elusimicrobia bacterium RIFOXYA2_FULL_53_38]
MSGKYASKIAGELKLNVGGVAAVIDLFSKDCTIPFIARYRKEATGNLDEVVLGNIHDRLDQLRELDARREAIIKSLAERNLLTEELKTKVEAAENISNLEDIYLPFRPKRRTRASIAKEKGLEPLADQICAQGLGAPAAMAAPFVNEEKGVKTAEEALAGARDIIAERVSEDETARARLRHIFFTKGIFHSRVVEGKQEEGAKFKDYFDWKEPAAKAPSHRVLAMRRGEAEGVLIMRIEVDSDEAIAMLEPLFVKNTGACGNQVKEAVKDSYARLLALSMEGEARFETKKRADIEAIAVFARNLRDILMASPIGHKNIMALDPGFRTGCKLVCLDRNGKLLCDDVIYPHSGEGACAAAAAKVRKLAAAHKTEVVAIGNGTAGRETEEFVRGLKLDGVILVMVNESGASVYSASEAARSEFPDKDVTVRGSVSIGRRLMDPLAELVKIDPKSIGVGQYQHDVEQGELKKSLDATVMSCVNSVGVEVNTASSELLSYVSGLGQSLAKNIVEYRNANGAFSSRAALKKVPRLGPKAFEQAAGFLRLRESRNPLDSSAVHPERYGIVERMAADLGCSVKDLITDSGLRAKIDISKYISSGVGEPTLKDIIAELAKPGRDPRKQFEAFAFGDVQKIEDLKPGCKLPGIVTNVAAFGAFVDIGVHQDGLVHISELSDRYVQDAASILKVGQRVSVTVLDVDLPRRRIALSLKSNPVIGPRESRGPRQEPSNPPQALRPDNLPRRPAAEKPSGSMAEAMKALLDKRRN